jgi:nanoRNase/pAp phosphatase (c-di-AMP/oligoRNAs hydrolase)
MTADQQDGFATAVPSVLGPVTSLPPGSLARNGGWRGGVSAKEEEEEEDDDDYDDDDEDYDDDADDFDYTFLKELDPSGGGATEEWDVDEETAPRQPQSAVRKSRPAVTEQPVHLMPLTGFNVVLTHCTADFDSLASAVGLAKLWSAQSSSDGDDDEGTSDGRSDKNYDSSDRNNFPTFVVLPRGAHPSVQRFLALHKHLFPIRSLKSLPSDLSGLNRLGLVDAQRRDRIGPAEPLLEYAKRITVVDHHVDMESDIPEATDYVVDKVGSVSTLIVERLMEHSKKEEAKRRRRGRQNQQQSAQQRRRSSLDRSPKGSDAAAAATAPASSPPPFALTEAEATLLALGIHADTGSLCYDSTTPRDAEALAWVMAQGASQVAIAEHAQSSLSREQQGVLTQALINTNSTVIHGVTVSTVLLTADGFINGLAAVTQDALELSSSDVYLLGLVYEPKAGGKQRKKGQPGDRIKSRLLMDTPGLNQSPQSLLLPPPPPPPQPAPPSSQNGGFEKDPDRGSEGTINNVVMETSAWKGGEDALLRQRLRAAFDRKDLDGSGHLDQRELAAALAASGIIASQESLKNLMDTMDTNNDGKVDFEEFVVFAKDAHASLHEDVVRAQTDSQRHLDGTADASTTAASSAPPRPRSPSPPSTLIIIGRAKAGVNMKAVKLGKLLEKYGGGGHAKAASATVRLSDEAEAADILSGLVDELAATSLQEQPTVGDFMTSPVLSVKPDMTERQVEDLFTRYDVRSLPVVNDDNDVIGLVTYKEVAAAKQRMWNKEQKRLREQVRAAAGPKDGAGGSPKENDDPSTADRFQISEERRRKGSTVKAWMKQHIMTVEASRTMAEVEAILLENDVGCIPVVRDGTMQLVGMVTRTDLLRQHRYYPSLHYNNKGMSDSIAARKPIIALRKRLKQFDLDE